MATVDITNWDEKNTASVGNLSDSSSFTSLQKVQPIKVTQGTGSGTGDAEFSSSTWTDIAFLESSSTDDVEQGIVVTESDESTTRAYEVESIDTSNNVAWVWVYGSWDSDGSDQIVIGAGTGDGTDYSQAGTGANAWEQTGIGAEWVQHLNGVAKDSTANNNDGTISGAITVSGQIADGLSFDGTDDNLRATSNVDMGSSDAFRTSQWVKNPAMDGNSGSQFGEILFDVVTDGRSSAEGMAVYLQQDSGNEGTVNVATFGDNSAGSGSTQVISNDYQLVVTEFDQSAGTITVYIDGNQDYVYNTSDTSVESNLSFSLGMLEGISGTDQEFAGDLDEAKVFKNSSTDLGLYSQAEYDASPKGGQQFFSWSGATATVTKQTISASTTTVSLSTPNPTVNATGTATINPPETTLTSSTPNPTVQGSGTVTINAPESLLTTDTPSPTVSGSGTVTVNAPATTLTSSTPSPTFSTAQIIDASTTTVNINTPNANVSGQGTADVNAQVTTLNYSNPDPTVTGTGTLTVNAPQTNLSTTTPNPDVNPIGAATIAAPTTTLNFSNPDPTLTAKGTATISASTTDLSITNPSPTISGVGTLQIEAPTTTLTANTPNPSVQPIGLATINAETTTLDLDTPNLTAFFPLTPRDTTIDTQIKQTQDNTLKGDIDK